jgi:hypothetical protein
MVLAGEARNLFPTGLLEKESKLKEEMHQILVPKDLKQSLWYRVYFNIEAYSHEANRKNILKRLKCNSVSKFSGCRSLG